MWRWTTQAYECWELRSDCSQCPVADMLAKGRYSFNCQIHTILDTLVRKYGEPTKTFTAEGDVLIMGAKQTNWGHSREVVLTYITQHPGCTRDDLGQDTPLSDHIIDQQLVSLFESNLIRKEKGPKTRIGRAPAYKYWTTVTEGLESA